MTTSDRYAARGVSSAKADVHAATAKLDKGLYPGAFCKILPDYLTGDGAYCAIQHADGAGSKVALAYLVWKLTGNLNVWHGIAQDSLVMNFDDMACAGTVGPFMVSSTIGRNQRQVTGEVLSALIEGCQKFCDMLSEGEIPCHFSGGETADLGDLIRTIVVDNTVTTRYPRADVVDLGALRTPALIVGFSSTGTAAWEEKPNSGMGSNGLTNARHDMLHPEYRNYPETYSPETDPELIYTGTYELNDPLPGDARFTIASALLAPTRTYLPMLKFLFDNVGRRHIAGLIHCTGGGQTKIGKFGPPGTLYVKDNLFETPPLFRALQEINHLPWRQMFTSYNMGHRLEALVYDQAIAEDCIAVAQACEIDARIVGQAVADNDNPHKRRVIIRHNQMEFEY